MTAQGFLAPLVPAFGGVDVLLRDGRIAHLRTAGPADGPALRQLHEQASERSIYLRFFSSARASATAYAEDLGRIDDPGHGCVVAEIGHDLIGTASYEVLGALEAPGALGSSKASEAEFALLIADDWQHDGLGTLLLDYLARVAHAAGIDRFVARVLPENSAMIAVLRDLGLPARTLSTDRDGLEVSLDIGDHLRVNTAAVARAATAEQASLAPLLSPKSVVVVGAGERADGVGHQILHNLIASGFRGSLYAVNPRHDTVQGVPCFPSVRELPEPVDLALVAVPAGAALSIVQDCGTRGIRTAVLITAGFDEADNGHDPADLLAAAREAGVRLIGPNCLGVANTDPAVRMNATFADLPMDDGRVGLLSQSGAVGIAMASVLARSGAGLSSFVSIGNKLDVTASDMLLDWVDDPRTSVIALYLESIREPLRFLPIARLVSARKPILALKSARSAAGARAGRSHTAAASSPDLAVNALFEASGVIRVDTMPELIDTARVLAAQPPPAGRRIVIVGNSGGPGIMAADSATSAGLIVASLPDSAVARLRAAVPAAASHHNPIDLGAGAGPADVAEALRIVLAEESVDMVLTVFTPVSVADFTAIRAAVAGAAVQSGKVIVAVEEGAEPSAVALPDTARQLPIFAFPEPAVAALAAAARYREIRTNADAADARPRDDDVDLTQAHKVLADAVPDPDGWLCAADVDALLHAYRIPTCGSRLAETAADAAAAAEEVGYPVAVKITTPGVHKSDVGGIRLGLTARAEVEAAAGELIAHHGGSVLVQRMAAGVEAIVGVVRIDPFGPLVMAGSGGVLVDILDDRRIALASHAAAHPENLLTGLKLNRQLAGFRGAPAASVSALVDVIARVSQLACELGDIAELDLNPVLCGPQEALAVDARIRLETAPPAPMPVALSRRQT